jgi:hypothetical protein
MDSYRNDHSRQKHKLQAKIQDNGKGQMLKKENRKIDALKHPFPHKPSSP